MSGLFIAIYNLLSKRSILFYAILILLIGGIAVSVSRLKLVEDIRAIIPQDVRIDKINMVLNESSFSDKIVINLSHQNPDITNPEQLIKSAEKLAGNLKRNTSHIKSIQFRMAQNSFQDIYDFIYNHLPFYLTQKDYQHIERHLTDQELHLTLEKAFKTLISPSGMALKKYIFKDPLNITPRAMKRLENFQLDDNFILHDSIIFTKDKKHLLIFIEPLLSSSQTAENKALIEFLNHQVKQFKSEFKNLNIEYYGGTAVAVANADRIKMDIVITVSAALAFLLLFFYLFFRKVKLLFLLFLPVVLGGGFSLALLSVFEGEISAIALGVGAVLLGISVDFSLHMFTHFRSQPSIKGTLKDISEPVMMSSLTTASAFLCLFVVHSEALQQLGMFAAFSVVSAAFFVLTILPFFLRQKKSDTNIFSKSESSNGKTGKSIPDRISAFPFHQKKPLIYTILGLTIIFIFTSRNITFNSDIASLNYLPAHLAKAEKNLNAISSETLSAVYLVTTGRDFNSAIEKTERMLDKLTTQNPDYSISTAADLMLSETQQKQKIEQWNRFWDRAGRDKLKTKLIEIGAHHHFKARAFGKFYQLLGKSFVPISEAEFAPVKTLFLKNYLNESGRHKSVISIVKADQSKKDKIFRQFKDDPDVVIFDRQFYTNQFFEILNEDFNTLVVLSMAIVLAILLIFYGRVELTLVTFIPIVLSWIWTLGLMGLFGIQFNIFNIIISTFIFGLGIDYSIFIMRGLLNQYKYGNGSLAPYKLSILLSSITTIVGIGVLIFAQHPALQSIALVSIFGILSVVLISYTVLPLVFSILINSKGRRRLEPVTFLNFFISIITLMIFVLGTISLVVIIPLLIILPLPGQTVKYLFHCLLMSTCRFIVSCNITIHKEYINKEFLDFKVPKIFVANHQSFLDLVLILLLNPKIIALTNEWVWKNPFIGFVVRFADYFPIFRGYEGGTEKIRQKVEQGYSVLVFPEGTRSVDGSIKRFHQGAFKLAHDLGLDLQPILIHGAHHCAPKSEFFLRSGHITIQCMKPVPVRYVDESKGETFNQQAKELTAFFRTEYEKLRIKKETPDYFIRQLFNQYIYKGPVLEWYVKIKMMLEKNFRYFNDITPKEGQITDIGCGYGYLGYMLHSISPARKVLGIDYDEEKIAVAKNIARSYPNLNYIYGDATVCELPKSDVFCITDVLHYLPEDLQTKLLKRCMENVTENGMIIVRDADADLEERTKITKHTELHSTRLLKFNKTKYDLSFVSGKKVEQAAKENGFEFQRVDHAKYTANITYILTPGKR